MPKVTKTKKKVTKVKSKETKKTLKKTTKPVAKAKETRKAPVKISQTDDPTDN